MTENNFRAARRASDITLESAGEICEVSRVTYQELSPGFRTRGFLSMYASPGGHLSSRCRPPRLVLSNCLWYSAV